MLPHHSAETGVRAEVQISRSGYMPSVQATADPFAKFLIYGFDPGVNHGVFGRFLFAVAEVR